MEVGKLAYGFLFFTFVYAVAVFFGLLSYEETQSIFGLIVLIATFAVSYRLTEDYVIKFDLGKLIGLGVMFGIAVGISLFLYQSTQAIDFGLTTGGFSINFTKILESAMVIVAQIIVCTTGFVAGSFLATLIRKEKE